MITLDVEYLKKLEKQAVKERDEAYIDFVKTGNLTKIKAYCKKYDILMPKNKKALKVGIYKAVQYCANIPEDVNKRLDLTKVSEVIYNILEEEAPGDNDELCDLAIGLKLAVDDMCEEYASANSFVYEEGGVEQ